MGLKEWDVFPSVENQGESDRGSMNSSSYELGLGTKHRGIQLEQKRLASRSL